MFQKFDANDIRNMLLNGALSSVSSKSLNEAIDDIDWIDNNITGKWYSPIASNPCEYSSFDSLPKLIIFELEEDCVFFKMVRK